MNKHSRRLLFERSGITLLVWLCLSAVSQGDEAAATKAIESLGGGVTLVTRRSAVRVDLYSDKVTNEDLKWLKELKDLRSLLLVCKNVTDVGLEQLKVSQAARMVIAAGNKGFGQRVKAPCRSQEFAIALPQFYCSQ